jgi:hypothetical protein
MPETKPRAFGGIASIASELPRPHSPPIAIPNKARSASERIGLDYFGIDCGLDRDWNLIVFEVNASMLVHDDNAEFLYKDPAVRAIKTAFGAMLRNRAGCGDHPAC